MANVKLAPESEIDLPRTTFKAMRDTMKIVDIVAARFKATVLVSPEVVDRDNAAPLITLSIKTDSAAVKKFIMEDQDFSKAVVSNLDYKSSNTKYSDMVNGIVRVNLEKIPDFTPSDLEAAADRAKSYHHSSGKNGGMSR